VAEAVVVAASSPARSRRTSRPRRNNG